MPANQRDDSVVPNAVVDTRMLKRAILARTSQPGMRGVLETLLEYVIQFLTDPERPMREARRHNFRQKPAAGNCTRHITAFQLLQAKFMRETPSSPITRRREVGGLAPQMRKRSGGEVGVHNQPSSGTGRGGSRRAQVSGGSSVQKMIARFSAVTQKEIEEPTQVYKEQGSVKQLGRGPVLSAMIDKFEAIATVHKGGNFTCPKTDPKPNVYTTGQGANEHKRCQDSEKQVEGQVSVKRKKGHSCEDRAKGHCSGQQAKRQGSWQKGQGEVQGQQAGLSSREPLYSSKAVEQSPSVPEEGAIPHPAKSAEVFSHPPNTTMPEYSNPDPSTDLISSSGLPQDRSQVSQTKPSLPISPLSSTAVPAVHSTESPPRMSPPYSQSTNTDYQAPNSPVSRGVNLQLDLGSTNDKMTGPHLIQLRSHAPQEDLPRYSLPRTCRPLSPEQDCAVTITDSHSRLSNTKATFPCEQPGLPEYPSPPTTPKTPLPLQPLSESLASTTVTPSIVNVSPKTTPLLLLSEPCPPKSDPLSTENLTLKTTPLLPLCEPPPLKSDPLSTENLTLRTTSILPLYEPPAPNSAPPTLPPGDLFITTAPSPLPSENLSAKTASSHPTSEPLTSDTSASPPCTHLPISPGSPPSTAPLGQVTEGEQGFLCETWRGEDIQNSSQNKPNVTLEITPMSSEAQLENNPTNYHSNQTTANENILSDKVVLFAESLPLSGPSCPQGTNSGHQAPTLLVSRGHGFRFDLSSKTDKTADQHTSQLLLQAPEKDIPKYSLLQTHGPLTPEWGGATMNTDSHNRPTSTKATFSYEQPAVPEPPSLPTAPKTAHFLPLSEPPAPKYEPPTTENLTLKTTPILPLTEPTAAKPAPSTLPSGDRFITVPPSLLPSEDLSPKIASLLPTPEPLTSDTGATPPSTRLPTSPGSSRSPAHLDQETEGEQRFLWEKRMGGDMQNSPQNKPNVTMAMTHVGSEALSENNPPDYCPSDQTKANQSHLSDKAQNGGPPTKYRTRNYEEACVKQTFKPRTIRFADTFTF